MSSESLPGGHLVQDPALLVDTALRYIPLIDSLVGIDLSHKIAYRRRLSNTRNRVSLVSGGGSGHEPSFTGFVGDGFLTAAVCGSIFASPNAEQIRRCLLHRVNGEQGILVVIMNYTGDVLNFGMAVEKARAEGLNVDMVVVGDDAGVGRSQIGKVGRRGLAGTVLVQKIAGALASKSAPFAQVLALAQLVAENVVTVGASLARVHVPGRRDDGEEVDPLSPGQVEIGMGIHNEPGSARIEADLSHLVSRMLKQLLAQHDPERSFLEISQRDALLLAVNNLGGISELEFGAIAVEVLDQLERDWQIRPRRTLVGTFMTSLNGLGFSITILRLADTDLGEGSSMLELLDSQTSASGWPAHSRMDIDHGSELVGDESIEGEDEGERQVAVPYGLKVNRNSFRKALMAGLERVIAAEPDITRFDTMTGDGDCGIGLERGAKAILQNLDRMEESDDVGAILYYIIDAVESVMDGTSGAIHVIFLNALSSSLRSQAEPIGLNLTEGMWSKALESSLQTLGRYTPAQIGDRTIIDALQPFVESLAAGRGLKEATEEAKAGADRTKGMKPKFGRAVYVGGEQWKEVPDPGAYGLSQFLLGIAGL